MKTDLLFNELKKMGVVIRTRLPKKNIIKDMITAKIYSIEFNPGRLDDFNSLIEMVDMHIVDYISKNKFLHEQFNVVISDVLEFKDNNMVIHQVDPMVTMNPIVVITYKEFHRLGSLIMAINSLYPNFWSNHDLNTDIKFGIAYFIYIMRFLSNKESKYKIDDLKKVYSDMKFWNEKTVSIYLNNIVKSRSEFSNMINSVCIDVFEERSINNVCFIFNNDKYIADEMIKNTNETGLVRTFLSNTKNIITDEAYNVFVKSSSSIVGPVIGGTKYSVKFLDMNEARDDEWFYNWFVDDGVLNHESYNHAYDNGRYCLEILTHEIWGTSKLTIIITNDNNVFGKFTEIYIDDKHSEYECKRRLMSDAELHTHNSCDSSIGNMRYIINKTFSHMYLVNEKIGSNNYDNVEWHIQNKNKKDSSKRKNYEYKDQKVVVAGHIRHYKSGAITLVKPHLRQYGDKDSVLKTRIYI